jgi:hypothetical protein
LYSVSVNSGCCNSGVVGPVGEAGYGVFDASSAGDSYINSGVRWK